MPHPQPSHDYKPEHVYCPKLDGGNVTLVNQNESLIADLTISTVPVTYPPAEYDEPGRH